MLKKINRIKFIDKEFIYKFNFHRYANNIHTISTFSLLPSKMYRRILVSVHDVIYLRITSHS